MTFDEALDLVMHHGKKIRRKDKVWYLYNKQDKLTYHIDLACGMAEFKATDYSGFNEDQKATDWEEVKE